MLYIFWNLTLWGIWWVLVAPRCIPMIVGGVWGTPDQNLSGAWSLNVPLILSLMLSPSLQEKFRASPPSKNTKSRFGYLIPAIEGFSVLEVWANLWRNWDVIGKYDSMAIPTRCCASQELFERILRTYTIVYRLNIDQECPTHVRGPLVGIAGFPRLPTCPQLVHRVKFQKKYNIPQ